MVIAAVETPRKAILAMFHHLNKNLMDKMHYLTDHQGNKTAVVIAMKDWENLSKFIKEVRSLEEVTLSVKEGLAQAKRMEKNQSKITETTEDFLDSL